MDISKRDWKLFRERLSGWQENYMEGLVKEYANFLNDDKKPASEKFWELEKRIKEDKRHLGVIMEMSKSEVIWDIVRLIRLKVIAYGDLSDMIPNYLVVKGLGLLDSYWALMLPGAVNAFNLIIVKNFFQELPHELEEAARIDGCSDVGIFAKIILPLSKPALASVGLFYAVSHWNDFFNSLIYLNSTEKFPVQIILRQIVLLAQGASADGSAVDFGVGGTPPEQVVKMAATVVATIPILCVYPFVQKYFEQGVMVGAVKG